MLVTPFMSCSARLPIYVLFASIFFGKYKMLVAYSLYLIGIVVALLVMLVLHIGDKPRSPTTCSSSCRITRTGAPAPWPSTCGRR